MKLFLILFVAGKISGTWGPLPYGLDECEARAEAMRADVATIIETGRSTNGANEAVPADRIENLKTWRISCEHRADRPALEE